MTAIRATLEMAKKLTEQGVLKVSTGQKYNKMLLPLSKYHKYGLLTDDLMRENEITNEALRRLPADVYQERNYRLARAIGINANKGVLPRDQWTTVEQDVSYLKPFVEQVIAEMKEKEDWNSGKIQ